MSSVKHSNCTCGWFFGCCYLNYAVLFHTHYSISSLITALVGECDLFQKKKLHRIPLLFICLRNPEIFCGCATLFCSTWELGCNCLFKDNNKGSFSEELNTAITSLEASTTTAVQWDTAVEDEEEREEKRDRLCGN